MWLIVSFLSQYNLHLVFCCVLSIFFIWWDLMALFCAAIRRDSIYFPFIFLAWDFVCLLLEIYILLFCFPFLFSSCCCFFFRLILVLSVLFLVAGNSLFPRFFMESLNHYFAASKQISMQASLLRPSFLDTLLLKFNFSCKCKNLLPHWFALLLLGNSDVEMGIPSLEFRTLKYTYFLAAAENSSC